MRLLAATISVQLFLFAYVQLAPWEQVNADIESWLEETGYQQEIARRGAEMAELRAAVESQQEPHTSAPRKRNRGFSVRNHTVGKGETFSDIWSRYAGSLDRFHDAVGALERVGLKRMNFKAGEQLQIVVRKDGVIRRVRKTMPDGRLAVLKVDEAGEYVATIEEPRVRVQHKIVTASIYGSLTRSALAASIPHAIVDEFVDLFANRVDFSKDLQPGDTFSIVYSETRVRGKERPIAASLEAAALTANNHSYAAVRHDGRDGKARYYSEKGELLGNFFLRYPLKFTRITSVFSKARFHPVLNVTTAHPGVDLAAPLGTPVRAVADGMVAHAARSGGAGNMIQLKHGNGIETVYMHLSRFAKGLRHGMRVERGQVIGNVGSTGLSTGPHLDYRLAVNGKFINPLTSSLPQIVNPKDMIPPKVLQATLKELFSRQENMALARRDLGSRKSSV